MRSIAQSPPVRNIGGPEEDQRDLPSGIRGIAADALHQGEDGDHEAHDNPKDPSTIHGRRHGVVRIRPGRTETDQDSLPEPAVMPPSMVNAAPVTKELSSDAR